jgi:phosphatidylglycerol lysyltransferase
MRKKSIWISIISIITLGSGIINLNSVIGTPGDPERIALLRDIFPLEFIHISRFLTLLIDFALIISSLNIYKRKKRGFQSVLMLSVFSIIFHLTKALDYEEALFSFLLIILLIWKRKYFTIKSSIPDLRLISIRLGLAILIVFSYGTAGFWFLDRKDFGINFKFIDSIHKTLLYLLLQNDPEIVPYTHYAHWFLNSLYLMSITVVIYIIFSLFRPVVYKFRILAHERSIATSLINKYGRSAQDFFKVWPDKSFFLSPLKNCFIAYRVGGNYALALGDPVGPDEEIGLTINNFIEFCEENDWGFGFHQTISNYLPIYKNLGLKKLKIGDEAIVDLEHYTLEGKSGKNLRHIINKFDESGFQIKYYEPPIENEIVKHIKEVSDEWLKIPGRRERGFTLGMFEPNYIKSTPVFSVINKENKIEAFVNIIPSYRKGESTIDLMRRRIDSSAGIMDYLFVKLFIFCKEKGYQRFNLGMAPMSGFQEKEEASLEEKVIHSFFTHLNFIFSYSGLKQYKAKFASFWEPSFLIYRNTFDLPRLGITLKILSEIK